MAPHSSTFAWKIPWTEEPGALQSMGSLRVRHGWVTSLSLFTFTHWRRKWQPTPVLLPGKIPWAEEPGRLPSMGSHRVGHSWSDFTFMHWKRKWQPIPVFLPSESQGLGSLVGCHLCMGSHRVRHDWSDLASSAAAFQIRNVNKAIIFCLCLTICWNKDVYICPL